MYKFAVKRLSNSDLSFFRPHLDRSKQKAINLNRRVFIDELYPAMDGPAGRVRVQLSIYGPGPQWTPRELTRKVLKARGGKNWRLNGELVTEEPDEQGRYAPLRDGDVALMAFQGTGQPTVIHLVLIAQSVSPAAHSLAYSLLSNRRMGTIAADDFNSVVRILGNDDLVLQFSSPQTVQEALLGPSLSSGDGRNGRISSDHVNEQVEHASQVGARGEWLFDRWLGVHSDGDSYEWVSLAYARASYDFIVSGKTLESMGLPSFGGQGDEVYVDVKTTNGPGDRPIHISRAELAWASEHPYLIARISSLDDTPLLEFFGPLSEKARRISEHAQRLPFGAVVDSYSVAPSRLGVIGVSFDLAGLVDDGDE